MMDDGWCEVNRIPRLVTSVFGYFVIFLFFCNLIGAKRVYLEIQTGEAAGHYRR